MHPRPAPASTPLSHCLLAGIMLVLLASCTGTKQGGSHASPFPQVYRQQVIAVAEAYSNHRWWASPANVRHGTDARKVRVDTPDTGHQKEGWKTAAWNTGVPYQWGGFDSIADFDRKICQGFAAGDCYTQAKRDGLETAVSREAAGIDCSGLISKCWGLQRSFSTRELPSLCGPLRSFNELLPGDILNTYNAHVLLFGGWADGTQSQAIVYEAGCHPHWRVLRREISKSHLQEKGYLPLRYRGILDSKPDA